MSIMYVHDEADFSDIELRNKVAEIMMSFLPGVMSSLRDVAMGDEKQGHKVTSVR